MEVNYGNHVLVVPYPSQGHINPMLQFSKRLISKYLKITLAITVHVANKMETQINCPVKVEMISDGQDEGGVTQASSPQAYLERFAIGGSQTLTEIIQRQGDLGDPVSCVVYDPFLPWALDVTKQFNLMGAAFYTQSCAVSSIYYYVQKGMMKSPATLGEVISLPGLPPLEFSDLPSFVAGVGPFPALLSTLLEQFHNFDKADWVLFSSFEKLEAEFVCFFTGTRLFPSKYLDKRIEDDEDYGFNLFEPKTASCMIWLNSKKNNSVVYVSFGSHSGAKQEQMEEIAWTLWECDYNFLWVVKESEENKIPLEFLEKVSTSDEGLMIRWCPQLEVLSHPAVGCFATHCGFNSTLEALSIGVPLIGFPQWTDQPTNAKCIEAMWEVGMRPKVDEEGIARKMEIDLCVREIMGGGEKGKEMGRNAVKWKELAKEAVDEGGSSDKTIEEFVAQVKYYCN
ncbi:UDP-glycosyltransferase 74F2-like [Papaver somniferum]|uniref:UDP-glycosyltransferase 74F2-like n=1 Tax=Papaver somniferum TaxID=3469 RepID=UPI000E704A8A|nr:UDP-glycosyltransferase 74F2-like [Papaver somniferum]